MAWLSLRAGPCVHAQQIDLGANARPSGTQAGHVLLVSDAVAMRAGKVQTIELHFRVDPGFHINSHKPADELMIATSLKLDPNPRLNVVDTQFPPGTPFRLQVGAGELLDVYQGDFRVVLRLGSVSVGESTLSGTLRYQACDSAACFPPKALSVRVAVSAK